MVYTVTFNPAVDYVVRTDRLRSGEVNRSQSEEIFFGGKGVNVSLMLNNLSVKSNALGFIAGFTGKAIEQALKKEGVETDFIELKKGFSRINVKIKSDNETELNGQGPEIGVQDIERLYEKLGGLSDGDTLVLAGSVPDTMPENIYEEILKRLSGRNIRFVVDASGKLLVNVLKYRPFLIKPNNFELGEIFSKDFKNDGEITDAARELQKMGAQNVLVSMADSGAILIDDSGKTHKIGVPEGTVVNSVGAGDSMVAGFLAGFIKKGDYDFALKLGTAAGSATAFSAGIADRKTVDEVFRSI